MDKSTNFNQAFKGIFKDEIEKIIVKLYGRSKKNAAKLFLLCGAGTKAGTTTTAENIAIQLANEGWKTLFFDCDTRKESFNMKVHEANMASLSDLPDLEKSEYDKLIRKTDMENLDYVETDMNLDNPIKLLTCDAMKDFIEVLRKNYDYIIMDSTSASISNDVELLLPYVDKYMLVVAVNRTRKKELAKARVQFADFDDKYMGVIVNDIDLFSYARENGKDKLLKPSNKNQYKSAKKKGK